MSIDVFPTTVLNSTLWNGQTYEEGTFTVTSTGHSVAQTGTAYYKRAGATVTVYIPFLTGTSNATTYTITGIPAALAAPRSGEFLTRGNDNGVSGNAVAVLNGQVITLFYQASAAWGAWTATGTKNHTAFWMTYDLASALSSPGWTGQSYEEGTFTVTATGFTAVVTGTATYVKIGKQVTLFLPIMSGTSNATTFTLTGLPAGLTPTNTVDFPAGGQDNSVTLTSPVLVQITAGSLVFTVYKDFSGAAWTATGIKRKSVTTVVYISQ